MSNLIGRQVIVVSNAAPFQVGTFKKWSGRQPVIDIDGKDMIVLGIVLPYSKETVNLLANMSQKEQWDWAADIVSVLGMIEISRSS